MKYWQEATAVAQRILIELWRRRRSLIFWLLFPIFILLLNAYITEARANLKLSQAMELAAPSTLVGAALFFSCLGGTVATIVGEREQKTLKRLFISPLNGVSYFLGIFLAHSWIGIGQGLVVYTIATGVGAQFQGPWWLGILIIVLSIAAYVGAGFILGTQLARRTEDVNSLVATFGVPLLILGGAFLPTSLFPDSLLRIAQFNPIYHMNQALLGVWAEGKNFSEIASSLLFLALFTLAMLLGGWLSYQIMLHREKRL